MFVNIVEFPPIRKGKEQQFRDWFKESNAIFSRFDGFVSRRLLISEKGTYAAIVEHKSKDTFMKMHNTKEGDEARAKLSLIVDGETEPSFYEVVEL